MHALVDDPGARADLDVVILAQRKDQTPHDLPEGSHRARTSATA